MEKKRNLIEVFDEEISNERSINGLTNEKILKYDLQKLLTNIFSNLKVKYNAPTKENKYKEEQNDDITLDLQGSATTYFKKMREIEEDFFVEINEAIKKIAPLLKEMLNSFIEFDDKVYNDYFGSKIINNYISKIREAEKEIKSIFTLKRDLSFFYYDNIYNIEIKKYNKVNVTNTIMYSEPFSGYSKGGTNKETPIYTFLINLLRIYCFYKAFSPSKEVVPGERINLISVEKGGKNNVIFLKTKKDLYIIDEYDIFMSIKYVNYHINLKDINSNLGNLPRLTLYFTFKKTKNLKEYLYEILPNKKEEIDKIFSKI